MAVALGRVCRLPVRPAPLRCATGQCPAPSHPLTPAAAASAAAVASAVFMCGLWATGAHPAPRLSPALLRALLPVALFHTVGHVSACLSFSQMAVSFTHVVKAAEPVLSVVLARGILGEVTPPYVWASLLPIIAGCSLAAMKEVSFSWAGFNNAMVSNVGMVLRNIYSKKYLQEFKHIDGINMFALLSIISIAYCAPLALAFEGFRGGAYQWGGMAAAGAAALGGRAAFLQLLAASGLFYHLYNQASYMVLGQGISPVTFSVGNTMKRVAVVVAAVVFFRNPVSREWQWRGGEGAAWEQPRGRSSRKTRVCAANRVWSGAGQPCMPVLSRGL